MAIPIFLTLCGLSVTFLVYVLIQLWRDGRPRKTGAEPATLFHRSWNPDLVVVTHPISLHSHGGISVIPLQRQEQASKGETAKGHRNARVLQMPASERRHEGRRGAFNPKAKAR